MNRKKNIEKLREELVSSIEDTQGKGLTKKEVIELSQRLDGEIFHFYTENSKKKAQKAK